MWNDVLPMVSCAPNTPCIHPVAHNDRLVRQHLLAAADERAMATRDDPLLVAQDDMTAVRSPRREERQEPAVDLLDMRAPAVAHPDRLLVERLGDGGRRVVQKTARRDRQDDFARRPVLAGALDRFDQAQVGVARRRRVIGRRRGRKMSTTSPAPGASVAGFRLQGRASGLELKALRRQVRRQTRSSIRSASR